MVEEVGGTIEWARDKLNSFPKAKRDLGPLLDALGREFPQKTLLFLEHDTILYLSHRTVDANRRRCRSPARWRFEPGRQPLARPRS
jgi:hypothetical protein